MEERLSRTTHTVRAVKIGYYNDSFHGNCFRSTDMKKANFAPHLLSQTIIRGQKITHIKKNSYWEQVGLKDGDVIVRVDNLPFNNAVEIKHALESSGKKLAFDIQRNEAAQTLWYNCE